MTDLNENLFPKNSPYTDGQQVSGFRFDWENEAGVISTSKIRNASIGSAQIGSAAITSANVGTLSFSQITGGTATLGGVADGNGLLTLKDSSDVEIVRLDNNGITISQGSISNVAVTTTTIESGTIAGAMIGTSSITGGTITSAVIKTSTIGTPAITGGTSTSAVINSATIGTPSMTGGSWNTGTLTGTVKLDVNSGSAALGIDGNFAIQTYAGSAVLAARVGGTTFLFSSFGTV